MTIHPIRQIQPRTSSVLAAWAAALGILVGAASFADDAPVAAIDPRIGAEDDAYLTRQAEAFLADVESTLGQFPPTWPEPLERRLALRLIDAVLHDQFSPNRPPVQSFYQNRIERVATSLETEKVLEGARIWKMYNHGFIVRTATVTLAFDLQPGAYRFRVNYPDRPRESVQCPGFAVSDDVLKRLVDQCDVLFISHIHGDHANEKTARMFIDQGKPVVAPPDVFADLPFHKDMTHLKREAHAVQELPVQGGALMLKVVVYPGQQYQGSGVPNNVPLVFTPEGMSFMHNGDQINDPYPDYQEDYKWIDVVKDHHKVDVYMTNSWTNDPLRDTKGIDPKVVLPGHENELGHPLWDRVPYWGDTKFLRITYDELKASGYPVIPMAWGESYLYVPGR